MYFATIIHVSSRPYPSQLVEDLSSIGFEVNVFRAFEPSDLTPELLSTTFEIEKIGSRLGYQPSMKELACALSHAAVHSKILERNSRYEVVFEDDVVIDTTLLKGYINLKIFDTPFPSIFQLGTRGRRVVSSTFFLGSQAISIFRYPPGQAAAYIMVHAAALLSSRSSLDGPADWPSWANNVVFFGLYPWCASDGLLESSIKATGKQARYLRVIINAAKSFGLFDFLKFIIYEFVLRFDLFFLRKDKSNPISKPEPWKTTLPIFSFSNHGRQLRAATEHLERIRGLHSS